MASVDFKKLHDANEVKAMIRHSDKEKRLEMQHSNQDIDKKRTPENWQLFPHYRETCYKYDEKILNLDSKPGANKRKDRVTAFSLEIPAPADLPEEKIPAWRKRVLRCIGIMYGQDNILNAYWHCDEVHEYIDLNGIKRISRQHMHVIIMPVHDGKLNGKWFSSKRNMMQLNREIHEMSVKEFGVSFMDGSGKKSTKTVEELKNDSAVRAARQEYKVKITKMIQTAYNDDFINYLGTLRLNNGKTARDLLDEYERRYKAHLIKDDTAQVPEPVSSSSSSSAVEKRIEQLNSETARRMQDVYYGLKSRKNSNDGVNTPGGPGC